MFVLINYTTTLPFRVQININPLFLSKCSLVAKNKMSHYKVAISYSHLI